ncbi:hypothetical protein [Calycomorphotria hydatis]|uniref:Uncharacterized protein n=1 Tax=Calycomorphotria hydatis TaxID=2528027 RepID=A0A517T750_9PLAN|nr:hypothetical protein [Calycomorphotria hydatis]QDT64197.1 hypothetical protein V22_14280 [Calycomorphotria hydatis]
MDAALLCAAVLVAAQPAPTDVPTNVTYRLASGYQEAVVRAQSPFFEELPPPGGGTVSPPTTFAPQGGPAFGNPNAVPFQPMPPGGDPFISPGGPALVPGQQQMAPDGSFYTFGANGPQPYRAGFSQMFDAGYIGEAGAPFPYSDYSVTELDYELKYTWVKPGGVVFSVAQEVDVRFLDGPATAAPQFGLPGTLYRFGWDFVLDIPSAGGPWSAQVAFNPSINTDFEQGLSRDAINLDGRGVLFYQASPAWTFALGVGFWDRRHDYILPYAGVIWTPNDRWEIRAMFPRSRITYFAGNVFGKPMWLYGDIEWNVESWEVERLGGRDQMQFEDIRLTVGIREDWCWAESFVEAGWVFDRTVDFKSAGPDFNANDSFLVRAGLRF